MAYIIDGKRISKELKDELKEKVEALKAQGKKAALAVIQVGNDPASSVYVNNKKKACAYIGIESLSFELPEETTEEEYKIMICPFCGKQEMCWLRYGMIGSKRIPYYICSDCQTLKI